MLNRKPSKGKGKEQNDKVRKHYRIKLSNNCPQNGKMLIRNHFLEIEKEKPLKKIQYCKIVNIAPN